MEHFLLYTGTGSLVMVLVGAVVVGFLVWGAVMAAVALVAVALRWLLHHGHPGA